MIKTSKLPRRANRHDESDPNIHNAILTILYRCYQQHGAISIRGLAGELTAATNIDWWKDRRVLFRVMCNINDKDRSCLLTTCVLSRTNEISLGWINEAVARGWLRENSSPYYRYAAWIKIYDRTAKVCGRLNSESAAPAET